MMSSDSSKMSLSVHILTADKSDGLTVLTTLDDIDRIHYVKRDIQKIEIYVDM